MLSKFELTPSENAKYGIYFVIVLIACTMVFRNSVW